MILGLDLSLSCPAFCVGEVRDGKIEVIHLSHLKTNDKKSFAYRLWQIYSHLESIYDNYPITHVVKERGFAMHNSTTAKLRGVDGVVHLLTFQKLELEDMPEIAPTTIKKIITGDGKADKEEVFNEIPRFLASPVVFSKTKARYDEADSVGVVISYAIQKKLLK